MKKVTGFFAALIALSLVMSGCARRALEHKETRSALYTFVTIHCVYTKDIIIDDVFEECWQLLDQIDFHMNPYADDGDLALLNKSEEEGRVVHPYLYEILTQAASYHDQTRGALNIAVFPLVKLWEQSKKKNQYPEPALLREAQKLLNLKQITFDDSQRKVSMKSGMRLDTGAIVKGFAIAKVAQTLKNHGLDNFMVNAGGDLYCAGTGPGGSGWRIGLQDPTDAEKIVDILTLKDMAVATSGNYEKYFDIQGKKLSHIIDPSTGYPAMHAASVTVITPDSFTADAYATALSVLGGKEALEVTREFDGQMEVFIIENRQGRIETFESKGYKNFRGQSP